MITLEGRGLHGGAPARITLVRAPGEVAFEKEGRRLPLSAAVPSGARRSTELSWGPHTVRTTEHLLSAFGGLGIHEGVTIVIEGDEVPLLDGRATAFVDALRELAVAPSPSFLEVVEDAALTHERTTMVFAVAAETRVSVTIDFGDSRISDLAAWWGDPDDYASRVACARTFGFAHEMEALAARGLASHVSPESVVILADDTIHSAGDPFWKAEPASHKLLDLVGDLFVHGGPPRGRVHAIFPGHAATHVLVARALEEGVLAVRPPRSHTSP